MFSVSQMFAHQIHSFSSPQVEPSAGLISQELMKKEIWQHALEVIRVVGFFIFPSLSLFILNPSARLKIPPGRRTKLPPSTALDAPAQHPRFIRSYSLSCITHSPNSVESVDLSKNTVYQSNIFIHNYTSSTIFFSVT
jgi:hypothetical protein